MAHLPRKQDAPVFLRALALKTGNGRQMHSGIPIHVAAARAGDRPTTLSSTYGHLLPQAGETAAERVAAASWKEGGRGRGPGASTAPATRAPV